jgi:hypothetical protein
MMVVFAHFALFSDGSNSIKAARGDMINAEPSA